MADAIKKSRDDCRGKRLCEIDVRRWLETEFAHVPTNVSEPVEVACFSRNSDRSLQYGSRHQLRHFESPSLGLDLCAGYERFREKASDEDGVAPVVNSLQHAGFDIEAEADVVSYRNNFNKIALTPYNSRDPYEFDAVRVGRTVFLDIRKIDEDPVSDRLRRFMYMGYHFEALCTKPSSSEPVDANEEFGAIMRLKIGGHRIVLGCEIDAEMPSTQSASHYVELKTARQPSSRKTYDVLYSDKYLKWFVQSYLGGVPTIIVGFRDDAGRLVEIEQLSTLSLPRIARNGLDKIRGGRSSRRWASQRNAWEPSACINFIDCTLSVVRRHCDERPGQVIRFSYDPRRQMLYGHCVAVRDGYKNFAETVRKLRGFT